MKDSIALEKLVAQIQSRLAPNSKIEHNVELSTLDGKRKRQIDVLVTDRIGQYEFKIAIDCKDHAKKLDVREVGTFNDLIQDVGAHRGVLVCPKGFTRGALARAEQLRIDLYSPIDTDPHKWQIAATAPCIIDYRAASISIQFSVRSPQRWVINDMNEFFDEMEILRPPINETIFSNWFNGKYPIEAGIHENQPIYEGTTLMKVNPEYEIKAPVHLTADVHVEQRYYFGYTQIKKISGFLNHQTGGVITNAFDLLVDFKEVESSWQMINTIDEAPMKPLFVATGLVAGSLP